MNDKTLRLLIYIVGGFGFLVAGTMAFNILFRGAPADGGVVREVWISITTMLGALIGYVAGKETK